MHVEAHPLDGTRPQLWFCRCRAEGLKAPVKYQWRFAPGLKPVANGPQDEPFALVQPGLAGWVECTATGDDKVSARAAHATLPLTVSAAPVAAKVGELITVRGVGLAPTAANEDGIWLVPARGAAIVADSSCKGASWTPLAVSACVPAAARGRTFAVRLQANEELASAAKPLVVAP